MQCVQIHCSPLKYQDQQSVLIYNQEIHIKNGNEQKYFNSSKTWSKFKSKYKSSVIEFLELLAALMGPNGQHPFDIIVSSITVTSNM